MPCDTMHSVIERAMRYEEIFVPNDYVRIIRQARKNSQKLYTVHSVTFESFFDFKSVAQDVSKIINNWRNIIYHKLNHWSLQNLLF